MRKEWLMTMFTGIFPALITPFKDDGGLDKDALRRVVEKLLGDGVDGFYVSGSTGESFMMTNAQRNELISEIARAVGGRAKVIVNVGSFSLDQASGMAMHARDAGVDAISSVPPFYFSFTMDEIRDYFLMLQEKAGLPFVIYNIPKMCGVSFSTTDLLDLLSHEGIVGIKQTTLDLFQTEAVVRKLPGKSVFSGLDELFLSSLAVGVQAMIGSTACIMPRKFREIRDAFEKGDHAGALRGQRVVNSVMEKLVRVGIFKGIKAVLRLQGIDCGVCKRPFRPLDDNAMAIVGAAYNEIND